MTKSRLAGASIWRKYKRGRPPDPKVSAPILEEKEKRGDPYRDGHSQRKRPYFPMTF